MGTPRFVSSQTLGGTPLSDIISDGGSVWRTEPEPVESDSDSRWSASESNGNILVGIETKY